MFAGARACARGVLADRRALQSAGGTPPPPAVLQASATTAPRTGPLVRACPGIIMLQMAGVRFAPLMAFQLVLLALFFVFARYSGGQHASIRGFEDTHVMIFVGFGFLMTFLKKYCYSALGLTCVLGALVVQWALLVQGFFHIDADHVVYVSKKSLLEADIMAATVLITFGVVLGVASAAQLVFIALVETVAACLNLWLVTDVFQASDVGGSIGIHTFGAYFGLGVSLALRCKRDNTPTSGPPPEVPAVDLNGPSYSSDVTAMIGSIFLWVYWPSFNSGLTSSDEEYERAVVNTYLSLAAATVTTFFLSSVVSGGRLDMVHVQNSTLAGGVAVGAVANLHVGAGGALAVGVGAALISVLGYRYLTPLLSGLGVVDTCGVHNLHGLPGVYSGLLSALLAALATADQYGAGLTDIFPAMKDEGRAAAGQALQQLLALVVTVVLALVFGFLTGLLSKIKVFEPLKEGEKFDDEVNWELP